MQPPPTKAPPPGWQRINSSLFYDDAPAAIDFLCAAFGFEVVLRIDGADGVIEHSELSYGEGLVMVGTSANRKSSGAERPMVSPKQLDGRNSQCLALFVDDADAHCAHARAAGATIADEPKTDDYGEDYWADRSYRAIDPEGHNWWFMQRLRGAGA